MDTLSLMLADPSSESLQTKAAEIEHKWGLKLTQSKTSGLVVFLDEQCLSLRQLDEPKLGAVFVDFASDALTFRRLHSGGKKESIAKAVGIKGEYLPTVIDATAGLGRDAFVLASLGCKVNMIERSPVVAALLDDGLNRAYHAEGLSSWLPQRMSLFHGPSHNLLNDWQEDLPDVVYLDPMFPHRKKSALVKKEMRLFQQMLGPDEDADPLLTTALNLATRRVVVKRPESAPFLAGKEPNMQIKGKKLRFDVYFTQL